MSRTGNRMRIRSSIRKEPEKTKNSSHLIYQVQRIAKGQRRPPGKNVAIGDESGLRRRIGTLSAPKPSSVGGLTRLRVSEQSYNVPLRLCRRVIALGDHPKAANEDHLKSGQRS